MKDTLQEYVSTIRKIARLESWKEELLKKLLHTQTPDGEEIADIIHSNWGYIRGLIEENLPDDVDDRELYSSARYIRDRLVFLKEDEDKEIEKQRFSEHHRKSTDTGGMNSDLDTFWDHVDECNDPSNEC